MKLIEPQLVLRGLVITLPEETTVRFDLEGLDGTDSTIEFCDFRRHDSNSIVIRPALRVAPSPSSRP